MPTPRPITIRPIARSDVPGVVEACSWLFEPPGATPARWDPSEASTQLVAMCDADGRECFVAVDGDGLVGFCTVYLDLVSIRFGQRAWLNELAVHPEHRSRRIGKQLLDEARSWAQQHGASYLMVDSGLDRTDAHRFYAREEPDMQAMCFGWVLVDQPAGRSRPPVDRQAGDDDDDDDAGVERAEREVADGER